MSPKNLFRRMLLSGFIVLVIVHNVLGQSWTTQYDRGRTVYGIKAVDQNTVWAGARSGAYFRTIDGGTTWVDNNVPGSGGASFFSVAPFDQNTAYLVGTAPAGGEGLIYKTTDGGQTWALQYRNTKPGIFFNGIAFWDRDNGIAFSDPVEGSFLIVTTNNGGATWQEVPKANIPSPLPGEFGSWAGNSSIAVEGSSNAWFGTTFAKPVRVFRTRDKGRTWTVANTPLSTNGNAWGIGTLAFIDSLNGYAGGSGSTNPTNNLMRTTDGGKTWSLVTTYKQQAPNALAYIPQMGHLGLVVNAVDGSFYTQDGGATWNRISSASYGDLTFVSPIVGWTTGLTSGPFPTSVIAKFNGNLSTAVTDRKSDVPQAFELAQNFPNPFNPETRIKFQVPATSWVQLDVFNLMGQHVATLLEGKRPAGEHELTWDGRNDFGQPAPSGVYMLVIRAGKFTQTKKMVLAR
jgi:photosystem II stability/assembly factor-like uncharacterized protein